VLVTENNQLKTKVLIFGLLTLTISIFAREDSLKTRNIILVTLDGLRWQEVFTGADADLIRNKDLVENLSKIKDKYWVRDQSARRTKLMPFIWTTLVPNGQIYGNRAKQSFVNLTNTYRFSYPGYNELLTGYTDPAVNSNNHGPNKNVNVFEFILDNLKDYRGNIAVFASWDTFNEILNDGRNHLMVNAGFEKLEDHLLLPGTEFLNELQFSLPDVFDGVRLDAITFYLAFSYLRANRPKILYLAFDETDDFAHQGKYDLYLNSIHYTDGFLQKLWQWIQSDPDYKDQTTLLITCDHGRGDSETDWRTHGSDVPNSDETWFAVIGPDSPALGEITNTQYYHNQLAATMSALLGLEYNFRKPSGLPVPTVLGR
jgi:hypothetical protein